MYRPADDSDLRGIRPLGRGGTAEVARAFHVGLKRDLAVKYAIADSPTSPDNFARLARREYDLIGGCRFPVSFAC